MPDRIRPLNDIAVSYEGKRKCITKEINNDHRLEVSRSDRHWEEL